MYLGFSVGSRSSVDVLHVRHHGLLEAEARVALGAVVGLRHSVGMSVTNVRIQRLAVAELFAASLACQVIRARRFVFGRAGRRLSWQRVFAWSASATTSQRRFAWRRRTGSSFGLLVVSLEMLKEANLVLKTDATNVAMECSRVHFLAMIF